MARSQANGAVAARTAQTAVPVSITKGLLRVAPPQRTADLDRLFTTMLQDMGYDALSMIELKRMLQIALAMMRRKVVDCKYGTSDRYKRPGVRRKELKVGPVAVKRAA